LDSITYQNIVLTVIAACLLFLCFVRLEPVVRAEGGGIQRVIVVNGYDIDSFEPGFTKTVIQSEVRSSPVIVRSK
jgi:hypothetical protein